MLVAGVDEAGRGPLAGPVFAAAVVLADERPIDGLDDSKKLTPRRRECLAGEVRANALAWSVAAASPTEIDTLNILNATLLAMRRAILGLSPFPSAVLVDGNRLPELDFDGGRLEGHAIVGGDASVASISAASILAKVDRDRYMQDAARRYPGYGFARHKGYGTARHLASIRELGPCPLHRLSFRPFRRG